MSSGCFIFWTAKDRKEAKKIAKGLLLQKKIACASILPSVCSLFFWEGSMQEKQEVKVIFKTQPSYFSEIVQYIQQQGSYEVPEVTQVQVAQMNPSYQKWMEEVLS